MFNYTLSNRAFSPITRFRFVRLVGGQLSHALDPGAAVAGISQFDQDTGQDCTYAATGVSLLEAGADIVPGAYLTTDGEGRGRLAADLEFVYAWALEPAEAGDVFRVVLLSQLKNVGQFPPDAASALPSPFPTTNDLSPFRQFASLSFVDFDSPEPLLVGTAFQKITVFDDQGPRSFTIGDLGNQWIKTYTEDTARGVYFVTLDVALSGSNNTTFDFAVFAGPPGNTEITDIQIKYLVKPNGAVGSISGSYPLELLPDEVVEVYIKASDPNKIVTVCSARLTAHML